MSLVAYNSSDESGQSDSEEDTPVNDAKETPSVTSNQHGDGQISDDDDDIPARPLPVTSSAASSVNDDSGDAGSVTTLLKGLPAPKGSGKDEVGEDELEEEVKPKPSQISDAPKPPPKRTKQPVRITIPKLEAETKSDEDEEPVAKKAKPDPAKQGKSGLFDLLPAPVHAAKKETNRILIPHALTRKPQAKKPAAKPAKAQPVTDSKSSSEADSGFSKRYTAFSGLTGYDSDSDEETTTSNFFSLDSAKTDDKFSSVKSNPDVSEMQSAPSSSKDLVSNVTPSLESSTRTVSVLSADESVLPAVVSHIPVTQAESPDPPTDQDAPLFFKPAMTQHNPLSAAAVEARYQYVQSASSSQNDQESYPTYPQYEEYQPATDEDLSQYMQDEQFLRLQGKNKRGKEEINIIDANMDDFVSTVDVSKNLTEESSYQSHRKKDNNPTTQQRRKKQITYLAFQAKERELELKNSWAQSRVTKRQTQAKYGF